MGRAAGNILVVEDEFLISEMVAEALADHGFEVHTATCAADALRHLAGGEPCDCLFTDINLAGEVDGVVLAQQARGLRPDLPVVYASGSVRRIDQLDAVPGSAFVAKPYDPNAVCRLVSTFARRRHAVLMCP